MDPVTSEFVAAHTAEVQLRDSTWVVVRPIVPEDREELAEGLARLSDRSRQFRFLTPRRWLSPAVLEYLTVIDYDDHFAWVALARDEPGQPGVGVARYIRDPETPTVAEAAVTVLDAYQRRGVGTILLELLAQTARRHGIEMFRAFVSGDNKVVLDRFADLVSTVTWRDGVAEIEAPLPLPTEDLIDTGVYAVLREAAAG